MKHLVDNSFIKLKSYCEKEDFKGWDPYDGLNSKVFQSLPLKKSRLFRLAWIQLFKRNPINLRKLLLVDKGYNPKALGLFLSGYCNLYQINPEKEYLNYIEFFIDKIINAASAGYSGYCWGYNFDWQAKAFFQPKYTPTVVATSFIANSLLDAYELTKDERLLKISRSSCDFVLKDLNRTYDKDRNFAFSYSPLDKTQVFNASLLGSRLLSRVYSYTKEAHLINSARRSVSYCCRFQQPDGSWTYSTLAHHQWIDNFHTGYNLECIFEYQKHSSDDSFSPNLEKGLMYYLNTFFLQDGRSKYYNNKIYPIDVHAPAQLVITLSKLGLLKKQSDMVNQVLKWTITNMQNEKGFFYYQKRKYISSTIPYIRWAQAWMFYALSFYQREMYES